MQEQDTTERILEHRGKAEAPSCTSETKTDYIKRVREAATCFPIALLPSHRNIMQKGLSWVSSSSSGTREPGADN